MEASGLPYFLLLDYRGSPCSMYFCYVIQRLYKIKIIKMGTRVKMGKVYPACYKALDSLDQLSASSSVGDWYQQLIKIRASQINGCAYCVNMHTQDALKLGIDARKINLTTVWREADTIFTEEEQLVIRMTEELTLIHQH